MWPVLGWPPPLGTFSGLARATARVCTSFRVSTKSRSAGWLCQSACARLCVDLLVVCTLRAIWDEAVSPLLLNARVQKITAG